jgi:2-dehydropantoate 2-reductase
LGWLYGRGQIKVLRGGDMKVCIVGAGAVGGFLGARLALKGTANVSALARGQTLAALRRHGWRLRQGDQLKVVPVAAAADDSGALGPQDLVIVAVKAQAMPAAAQAIKPLLGPQTIVLPAMNGVPWWFAAGLTSVDPGGTIAAAIPLHRVIGCVVHFSAATEEPGLVAHKNGTGLIIGEPEGKPSSRLAAVHDLLATAGFDVTSSPAIRHDVWYKLWGNLTMNPVSALTGATGDRMLDDPLVRGFCSAAMREAAAIGSQIGCAIDQDPIELDAIVTAVHELGRRTGVPTPNIDALLGLTRLYARVRGLYPD